MVDLIDEQLRKSEGKDGQVSSKPPPNQLSQVYVNLKRLIETRRTDQSQFKIIEILQRVVDKGADDCQPA